MIIRCVSFWVPLVAETWRPTLRPPPIHRARGDIQYDRIHSRCARAQAMACFRNRSNQHGNASTRGSSHPSSNRTVMKVPGLERRGTWNRVLLGKRLKHTTRAERILICVGSREIRPHQFR